MAKETKSNGQKDLLDRFYTSKKSVQECLALLNLTQYDCIIEPSAGTGSFSNEIPNCYAYDIAPANENIVQADWFKLDKTQFQHYKSILVIGNPPFGQQNTLATQFFNESAKFANTIAFILPLSFKKDSVKNRLNENFHLIEEIILTDNSFTLVDGNTITVPCVFQIWEKQEIKRQKITLKTTSALFDFTTADKADFRIQRVGGNAGKASFDLTRAASSNYFIKNNTELSNEKFVEFVNNLIFPSISFTVGPKSLSKGELIAVIEENWIEPKKEIEFIF